MRKLSTGKYNCMKGTVPLLVIFHFFSWRQKKNAKEKCWCSICWLCIKERTCCCCCCQVTSVVSDSVWPHRRQPTRLPHPWDSLGKNTGVGCHFLLQCVKVKLLSHVWLLATPWTVAQQASLSMGLSRQEYWSGVPLPSPMAESWRRSKEPLDESERREWKRA